MRDIGMTQTFAMAAPMCGVIASRKHAKGVIGMRHDLSVEDYHEWRNGVVSECQKRRREKAKEKGLCRICCIREAREGRTTCYECTEYILSKAKARTQERKEKGLCTVCGKRKPKAGRVRCASCTRRANVYHAKRRGVI